MNEHVRVVSETAPHVPDVGAALALRTRVKRRFARWAGGALLVAGLVALAAYWITHQETAPRYVTVPISQGAVTRVVSGTGTVNPVLTIIVGSYVSGVIQSISCDFNTKVKKGQLCAKIDPRPYETEVNQAAANLTTAKAQLVKDRANLTYAQTSYERNAKLLVIGGVSQDAADLAKNAYDQAQAQITYDEASIKQHEAALEAAQVNLGYTNIVSPVDGIVVSRNVTIGQTVAASFQTPTLFLIATDLTKMQVDANVSESDIGMVKAGDRATFTVDSYPNRSFQGAVMQVRQAPQTVQNVVTYDVVIAVDNKDQLLKPGMTATTRIVTAERESALRVPDQALRFSPGGLAGAVSGQGALPPGQGRVWLMANGSLREVPLKLGLDDDSFTEIVSGEVKSGDQVATAEESGTASRTVIPRLRF